MFQTTNQFSIATTNWWFVPPIYGKIGDGGSSCFTHISLSGPADSANLISKNMDVSRVKPCQCIDLRDLQFTGYSMSFLLPVKNVTGFTGHIFPSTSHLWPRREDHGPDFELRPFGLSRSVAFTWEVSAGPKKKTSKLVASWGFKQQIVNIHEKKWKSWEYHGNSMRR